MEQIISNSNETGSKEINSDVPIVAKEVRDKEASQPIQCQDEIVACASNTKSTLLKNNPPIGSEGSSILAANGITYCRLLQ